MENRFLTTLLLCALCGLQLTGCSSKKSATPNVIFIVLDAARADHFSSYGYERNTTPRMDKIGEEGAIFLNHFSNATYTANSVPKYLFSRYYSLPVSRDASPNYKIRRESPDELLRKYDEQQILLPEVFSQNDYTTLLIHNNGWFDRYTHIGKKFDENLFLPLLIRNGKAPWEDKIITELIAWIKKNKDSKFFVYCHIMSPHSPYPEKESDEIFLTDIPPSEQTVVRKTARKSETGQLPGKQWNKREIEILNGLYDSNLHHADLWIGYLFEALEKMDLDDETLVVISSDHGEMLGEHHSYGHHKPEFDGQIRVPLILRYPPRLPGGSRISGMTESVDIMPTILDICGLKLPKGKAVDGMSLLNFITDPAKTKTAVFTERAVRTQDYKYIMSSENMLFDLKNDPGENKNLANEKPKLARKMRDLHSQNLAPYRDRYKDAVRKIPPAYMFYFSIDNFRITPKAAYQRLPAWEEESAEMPWVLIRSKANFGLYRVPKKGDAPPLTVTSKLLNGAYEVSVLLESAREIDYTPAELGFLFRYGDKDALKEPLNIEFFRQYRKNYLYYLDLGWVEIKNAQFTLEFDFSPPDDRVFIIRMIKFVPEKFFEEEIEMASDEEVEVRMKNLKSLGYIK